VSRGWNCNLPTVSAWAGQCGWWWRSAVFVPICFNGIVLKFKVDFGWSRWQHRAVSLQQHCFLVTQYQRVTVVWRTDGRADWITIAIPRVGFTNESGRATSFMRRYARLMTMLSSTLLAAESCRRQDSTVRDEAACAWSPSFDSHSDRPRRLASYTDVSRHKYTVKHVADCVSGRYI